MSPEDSQERIDPRLAAAYDELRQEDSPDVDWERLRRSIRDRAVPALRRRKARKLLMVSRPALPLALAASIAFALWLGPRVLLDLPSIEPSADVTAELDDDALLIEALVADLSEQEFRLIVTGRANPEALLAVAAGDR
ncbi:MAG TPA: hypothetical protein VMN39_13015 [Longimicrobiaceae bacterium]|nr:hypothetical protein [Longimicrobiaceae bacterium]